MHDGPLSVAFAQKPSFRCQLLSGPKAHVGFVPQIPSASRSRSPRSRERLSPRLGKRARIQGSSGLASLITGGSAFGAGG